MELQLFIYKNLAVHFYYSEKSFKNNTVSVKNLYLCFPGLPQILNKDFFINKVDKNTAFFSVYYLGSWLSGEKFSYRNCRKSIDLAIKLARQKQAQKTFDNKPIKWHYRNLNIIGYSFAGNPILTTKINKNEVKNIFLFSPLIFLHHDEVKNYLINKQKIKNFYDFSDFYLNFLRRGYKFAFRGINDTHWDTYFKGKDKNSKINISEDFPFVYIFHGLEDEKISPKSSKFLQGKYPNKIQFSSKNKVKHNLKELIDIKQLNNICLKKEKL